MIPNRTVQRGGSTGCGRCFHHSYPTLSEKKWSEDTSVLSRKGMGIVFERSPTPCAQYKKFPRTDRWSACHSCEAFVCPTRVRPETRVYLRLHPPTPQTHGRSINKFKPCISPLAVRGHTPHTITRVRRGTHYSDWLVYLGTSRVLLYPPEATFPCFRFRAQPLATLGGPFRRRGGSTGPTGGASTILIPHYLKRRNSPKIHPYDILQLNS